MIEEWKRCIKLIKYGYNLKSSIVCGLIFFVIGIIFCILDGTMFAMGGLYIILGPMMLVQISYTALMAGMPLSAPRRRFMETKLQDGLQFIISILGYFLVILFAMLKLYQGHYADELGATYGEMVMYTGMMSGILMIYYGIVYKYFLTSLFLLVGGFALVYMGAWGDMIKDFSYSVDMVKGSLIGLLCIIMGGVIGIVLRRILYKKPLNKYAMGAALRKQM